MVHQNYLEEYTISRMLLVNGFLQICTSNEAGSSYPNRHKGLN